MKWGMREEDVGEWVEVGRDDAGDVVDVRNGVLDVVEEVIGGGLRVDGGVVRGRWMEMRGEKRGYVE